MLSSRAYLAGVGGAVCLAAGCIGSGPSSHERLVWSRSLSGVLLFDDGTVYQSSHNDLATRAVAASDGSVEWTVGFDHSAFDERLCFGGPLEVDDQRVYVPGCDGLRAIRRSDGEVLWRTDAGVDVPPAVADGTVFANTGDLVAVGAGDAESRWRAPIGGAGRTRPAVEGRTVVVTDRENGVVYAFDLEGAERWRYRTDAETRSPTLRDGMVYIASVADPATDRGTLTALSIDDGRVGWTVETPKLKRGTRPVVTADRIYLGCSGREHGQLVALTRADGSRLWSRPDDNSTVYQPVVAGERVYAGSNDDTLYAWSRDGRLQWAAETGSVVGSVVVGPDRVYATNHTYLMAFDRD